MNIKNKLMNFVSHYFAEDDRPKYPTNANAAGTTGTEIYSGYFNEEYLQKLLNDQGIKIFDKMRRADGQVAMLLQTVKNPIKSASWLVESVDESEEEQEIAEFVEHVLFNDIGTDEKSKTWQEFIEEALTVVEFGHSVFEIVHKVVRDHPKYGNYIGLADLGFRHQRTILEWKLKKSGAIENIRQLAYGDLEVEVDIDGKFLMVFSVNKEGDNYQGISMLRPCYGSWFRKDVYRKLQAIGIERCSKGAIVAEMPADILKQDDYDKQRTAMQNVIDKYMAHQTNGITSAPGFVLKELKISHDAEKVQAVINSENVEMSKAFLANFMELGLENNGGSFSLGKDLSDIFLSGIECIGDMLADRINRSLVVPLVVAKYGHRENYPKLIHNGINSKVGEEFANVVQKLIQAGAIRPSDRLEKHLSSLYGLPDVTHEQQEDNDDDPIEPDDKPDNEPVDVEEVEELHDCNNDIILTDTENLVFAEINTTPPKSAQDNAKRGLEMREKWGRGGTQVGVARARDISNASRLSRETIARMSAFQRHEKNYRPEIKEDDGGPTAGTIAWLLWGGNEGIKWAEKKLEEFDNKLFDHINDDVKLAEIQPSFYIKRKADDFAEKLRESLRIRSEIMIDTMINIARNNDKESARSQAMAVRMPQGDEFKEMIKEFVGEVGNKAFKDVLKEIGMTDIRFDEFDNLPEKSKAKLLSEVLLTAGFLDVDIEKVLLFSFNLNLDQLDSPNAIKKEIITQRDKFIDQQNVSVAATNMTSKVVNTVRNDVYQEEEVFNEIESFVFMNPDPKSAICQNLVGRVFSKEEYETTSYLPPLHHNCYDKDTEVYTDKGWKLFSDVDIKEDKFLSLNPDTFDMEYAEADNYIKRKHNGEMYHFTNNQRSVSQCVTPDHPMLYMKRIDGGKKGRRRELVKSSIDKMISHGNEAKLYCTSQWTGERLDEIKINGITYNVDSLLKFMGYYLSEGHVANYYIAITQHKLASRDQMFNDLNGSFDCKKWATVIRVKDDNLTNYLKPMGKSFQKYVPEWIKNLSPDQIKIFLDAYCLGDGSVYDREVKGSGHNSKYRVFTTASKRMADDLSELIIKTGKSASLRKISEKGKISSHKNGTFAQNHDVWGVFELSSKTRAIGKVEKIKYNDFVYDLSLVKNHTLLTKRDGCISWGSNCKSFIKAQRSGKRSTRPVDPVGLNLTGSKEEVEKALKSKTL